MNKTTNNILKVFVNVSVIVSVCVGVSSCSLYKKYDRPQTMADSVRLVRDPMDVNKQLANTTDTTNFGDVAWQQVFTDPQLQKLIQDGLAHNVDMLNAAESVKQAEAQLNTARLAYIPSFSLAPQGTLANIIGGNGAVPHNNWNKTYSVPVNATWNVDMFGSLVAANRSAKVAMIASKDYQQAVRSRIICGIARSYYTLLMLDRELIITTNMEKLMKETWEMMKLQKELRGVKETSVVAAEASYLSAQSQAIDIRRSIRETENSLALLIGESAQTVSRSTLDKQNLPTSFAAGVNIKLLTNRPDIHANEMALAQCFYGVEQARAAFLPSLKITSTGSYTNSQGTNILNPGLVVANFVGNLTQPIFSNGKLTAGLKVAKSKYQQALNTWEHSILSAGSEVSNALVLYNSSNEKSQVDQKRVEALDRSVNYTKELFRMGTATYLEVITAQQSMLEAELNKVTDDFNKMSAVVSLYSALGGGRK